MFKVGTIVLALAAVGIAAPANAYQSKTHASYNISGAFEFAPEYGTTLPPIGYVQFCARHKDDCRSISSDVGEVDLTPEVWANLREVNTYVNDKIVPATDQEIYNEPERWEYPDFAGDCEDYVLMKKRYLEGLGIPQETLLITVVLDEHGDGHAVLMVRTSNGDFILDNRRNEILRWSDTKYEYLKRQSQANPRIWVSMTGKNRRMPDTIAGAN